MYFKKNGRLVSRVLYFRFSPETFIIYLAPSSLTGSCSLPLPTLRVEISETERATPLRCNSRTIGIYLALQPVRRTADCVATTTGGLLPHLFTRSPINRDGYFLLCSYPLSEIFLLGSTAPCVARTFLSLSAKSDKAACHCKNSEKPAEKRIIGSTSA